jgi:hypothetical protein
MRYFLLIFGLCVLTVMLIAGKRGTFSRNPPLYMFPDMDRQLKLRPQEPNGFFANGVSSQLPPAGTVARGQPISVAGQAVYAYEDSPVWTGFVRGTTNYLPNNPFPVTAQLMKRGQERFNIFCSPCHGGQGDGVGITKKLNAMPTVLSLLDPRIVKMTDGEIFFVITQGRNTMLPYGPNVPAEDRWAIITYLRALQLSRLGTIDDVPPEMRANLK